MPTKRLLDLFCGVGGTAMGYHQAGFAEIVGVDIKPMPRYPFTFVQANALDYVAQHGKDFDVIHASPPCQKFSAISRALKGRLMQHQDLVSLIRSLLVAWGGIYVIENVVGAPLLNPVMLCGSMFDLKLPGRGYLRRHRLFESNFPLKVEMVCTHRGKAMGVFGHGGSGRHGTWGVSVEAAAARELMGISWANRNEVAQAIPPAFTNYLGRQILAR